MKKRKIYAAYKGDEFIDLGTKEELAQKLNTTIDYLSYLTTPTYKKRRKNKGNSMIVIKLDDEEEEINNE